MLWCVLVSIAAALQCGSPEAAGASETNHPAKVMLAQLLQDKDQWRGRRVEVTGYYVSHFETRALYANKADARQAQDARSVWLDYRAKAGQEMSVKEVPSGRVRVVGTFQFPDRGGCGHFGQWPAQLTEIEVLEPLGGPEVNVDSRTPLSKRTVLEKLLVSKDFARRVKQVEQDLPTDTWTKGSESKPGRLNSSRSQRESALANELITKWTPKLKKMSAIKLLGELKTFPYGTVPENFSGVAYYVNRDGNKAIIKELSTRNQNELQPLRGFQDDQSEVFTGDDGPPSSVGDIVRSILLERSQQTIEPGRARTRGDEGNQPQ